MEFESRCASLFERLRAQAFGVEFHLASNRPPALLCSLSSALLALSLFDLDPKAALAELRALYASCQRADGMLALERACSESDRELRIAEFGPIYGEDERSCLIGPPIAAFAAARFALSAGQPARDLLVCATRHLDAIWGARLPPDTSLPVILHPLESGVPGSPLFDSIVETADLDEWREHLVGLLRSAVACQLEPDRALRAGHTFVVEDPVFCGWLLVALEEASLAWRALGDDAAEQKLRIRSELIAEAIVARLWWEPEEIFAGYDRQRELPMRVLSAGGLVPAAARLLLQEGSGRRTLARQLRPGATPLWGKQGISFNPIVAEAEASSSGIPWRGNTISPLVHDWAHLALTRAERGPDARVAREQIEDLALEHGLREFYDAISGKPRQESGEHESSAALLALAMRAREEGI